MASNIGGTATLIGDPPNIMIGSHVEELSFLDFIVNLGPVAAVTLLTTTLLLYFYYRRSLATSAEARERVAALDPRGELERERLVPILVVLGGTIVGFFLHAALHVEPVTVAMAGATAMLLVSGRDLEWALERVEWGTIFFFLGLFIMVGSLEEQGLISKIADGFAGVTGGSRTAEALVVLWGAAAGSALVDNIPFTAAMIPVVDELQVDGFDDATWWALALGACFGGKRHDDRGRGQRRRRLRSRPERDEDLVPALSARGRADHADLARDCDRLSGGVPAVRLWATMRFQATRMTRGSLYRRVFLLNAAIFVFATLTLTITPATISFPVEATEAIVLVVGLGAILVLNAFALRTAFAPLDRLTRLMSEVDLQNLFEALKAGASGYVLKSGVDRDLIQACRAAMRDEPFLYPSAIRTLIRDHLERRAPTDAESLTPRETQIVKLIAESYSSKEIAELLVISPKTVERHRANILKKLGMSDRVELTRYAIRRGIVEP